MNATTKDRSRRAVGATGEAAVRQHALGIGWSILDHNVRWREGELDLIAVDRDQLVIAEVKTLVARGQNGATGFSPLDSIDHRKRRQVRMLARRWLIDNWTQRESSTDMRFGGIRFDAFGVTLDRGLKVLEIEHIEDAF